MTDKKASPSRKRTRKPAEPDVAASAVPESPAVAPGPASSSVSGSDVLKNPRPEVPSQPRGNPGAGSRFIPGGNSQGSRNGNRKASWNPNLAVSRGHPNGAARTSR